MVNDGWNDGADPDDRVQAVRRWRRLGRAIRHQERALGVVAWSELDAVLAWLGEVLDYLKEQRGDLEYALALDLRDGGPVACDGRLYSHWLEDSTGCHRVGVRPLEPDAAIGTANCPERAD